MVSAGKPAETCITLDELRISKRHDFSAHSARLGGPVTAIFLLVCRQSLPNSLNLLYVSMFSMLFVSREVFVVHSAVYLFSDT